MTILTHILAFFAGMAVLRVIRALRKCRARPCPNGPRIPLEGERGIYLVRTR